TCYKIYTLSLHDALPIFYSSGDEIVTAEYLGWKFRLTICYDLRFPVWLRNTDDYDVMICPASWPKVRIEQWKAMLKSRAIENLRSEEHTSELQSRENLVC